MSSRQDIDIVIFGSGRTTEDLKQILARQPDFYLRPSRKVGETYKILFYKLKPSMWGDRRSCKVDILIPGIMNIPDVPHHRIVRINALPVLPIFVLLLLKLQGWSDHRASTRSDMQQKQYVDIRDINQLVAVVAQKGEKIAAQTWLPASFIQRGREHLELYLRVVRPSNVSPWREIGFDVPL